jgi:hypothetical protein
MTENSEVHFSCYLSTHSGSYTSTLSSSKAILTVLDNLIKEGGWGTKVMNNKVEANVLAPLRQRIKEETSDDTAKSHMKALKSLALNPHELREFATLVVTGAYRNSTFAVSELDLVHSWSLILVSRVPLGVAAFRCYLIRGVSATWLQGQQPIFYDRHFGRYLFPEFPITPTNLLRY